MDLAGQPLAFGEHAGGVFRGGQFTAGRGELLDETAALFALPVEGLVAEDDRHGDRGAQGRAEHRADAQRVGVPPESGDGDHGGGRDGGQRPAQRQQMQLDEEQREGQPDAVLGEGEQHRPEQGHGGEPEGGGTGGAAQTGQPGAGGVHGEQRHGGGEHGRGDRGVLGQGAYDGEREQRGHQQMQAAAQDPQDGGEGVSGHGFFGHGSLRLSAVPTCGINQRVDSGAHRSMPADRSSARCPGPAREETVGAAAGQPGPAHPLRGGLHLCSSPGGT